MICPRCKAEYRQGFTVCADCEVALVASLSPGSMVSVKSSESDESEGPGGPDERGEDPICTFWKGDDPRIHVELCEILDRAGIPHTTLRRSDHLFNLTTKSAFQLGIPFSCFEKAEALVKEAYGSDEDFEKGEFSPAALPESVAEQVSQENWDPDEWYPEDATVEVWSSGELDLTEMLTACLRENQIHSCSAAEAGRQKLYVLPEDEARAREIVRQVMEGAPPE